MKKVIIAGFITIFSGVTLFFGGRPDGKLHVYFLDVGQGDSIFIQTPTGKRMLIDGGPGMAVISELKEVLPFFIDLRQSD